MRLHIKIQDYDGAGLSAAESNLRQEGYRLVFKNSESDLLPGEYIKQDHSWSVNSFGEQHRCTLRWRVI